MSMLVILVLFAIFTSVMPCGPGRGIGGPRRPRKLTPLVFKQHVPNFSENTINAAGLPEGKITRDHEKFKDLETNYNEDIIFKDDEGTGADRVMTRVSRRTRAQKPPMTQHLLLLVIIIELSGKRTCTGCERNPGTPYARHERAVETFILYLLCILPALSTNHLAYELSSCIYMGLHAVINSHQSRFTR